MRLTAFRITNFRSIVDSRWVDFSPDGVTVIVGQNESGKTSVLQALSLALSSEQLTANDVRIGAPLPAVTIRAEVTLIDIREQFEEISDSHLLALAKYFDTHGKQTELLIEWMPKKVVDGMQEYEGEVSMRSSELEALLREADVQLKQRSQASIGANTEGLSTDTPVPAPALPIQPQATSSEGAIEPDDVALAVWRAMPLAVYFDEDTGHLPNQVDIEATQKNPMGPGAKAAQNFLLIADISLVDLLKGDRRAIENTLNKANSRISQDFNNFWSQTIGGAGKLSLKCEVDYYSDAVPEKAGKPHLVFWICNGNTQLYPLQRSRGVRWFVSFYLQLKASEKSKASRLFLFDEPGANLHSKAQGDVLKLLNTLGKDTSIVAYSTHSPEMLEYEKFYRVHAVQRDGAAEDSPTTIIDAHRLGTASSDTLSPVFAAMGGRPQI